jgi:predicted GIY-YIG superfamily endonuclease
LFTQVCESRSDALKKESAFKKLTRDKKLEYMCDAIEKEMLAQIAKMEEMQAGNTPV